MLAKVPAGTNLLNKMQMTNSYCDLLWSLRGRSTTQQQKTIFQAKSAVRESSCVRSPTCVRGERLENLPSLYLLGARFHCRDQICLVVEFMVVSEVGHLASLVSLGHCRAEGNYSIINSVGRWNLLCNRKLVFLDAILCNETKSLQGPSLFNTNNL